MDLIRTEEEYEAALTQEMGFCSNSSYRFVMFSFPWGEGKLAEFDGPDAWQVEILRAIDAGLITPGQAIQIAIASGHGVGKSALVSWLILWALSTFEDTKGVVTANTETQLRTKTWAEVGKWFQLFICRHWFKMTATAIFSAQPGRDRTWRIDMVPWSENNTEAFAGLHNQGKRVVLLFDEASAIPDMIWETSEGALTDKDTQILWFAFGNPTRNTGRFKGCFTRFRHRWTRKQIDSRTVAITNKDQIQQWVDDYGEDSDFVRVRVRGVFPRAGDAQFISGDLVDNAVARYDDEVVNPRAPLVLGVDVARFGDDQTVLLLRQGRKVLWIKRFRGKDNHFVAAEIIKVMDDTAPDAVFVDGGAGAGVIDIVRSYNRKITEVMFGSKALKIDEYFNKRAEMWGELRHWLMFGAIPPDQELQDDLIGPEYGFARESLIQLERKEDMKKRGLASPDAGDALALTFARPVTVGGEFFKVDWIMRYQEDPPLRMMNTYIVTSTPHDRRESDWAFYFVIGLGGDENFYILDMIQDKLTVNDRATKLIRLHRLWKKRGANIRGVGYSKLGYAADIETIRMEQESQGYVFQITPTADKLSRLERVNRLELPFQEGRMRFPHAHNYKRADDTTVDLMDYLINWELKDWPYDVEEKVALAALSRLMDEDMNLVFPEPLPESDPYDDIYAGLNGGGDDSGWAGI